MNAENFFDAMGQIDSKYIEEAVHYKAGKKKGWMRWCAAAACLCLVVGGVLLWKRLPSLHSKSEIIQDPQMNEAAMGQDGVTIPPAQFSLELISDPAVQSDMIGFFIYQGRTYVQYGEWLEDNGMIVGEYLGTATGLIDEWTPSDGYVELAGSVSGDFYSVQGYDPAFILCMQLDDGRICTYICNTGITLQYGSELYEDRLHLSENYISVQYESRKSWYFSDQKIYTLDTAGTEVLNSFISALNAAEFMLSDDIPLDEEDSIYDKEIYHMYFQMQNGMTVELRLFEGGYVSLQGIRDVCVQIPEETFASLVSLFEN